MKKLLVLLLVTALSLGLLCIGASAEGITPKQPAQGNGTADDPYQISSAEEFYWFAGLVNGTLNDGTNKNASACAVLTADIDLKGSKDNLWTPIGNKSNPYKGTFDGQGHSISGLYINVTISTSDSNVYVGLFGCLQGYSDSDAVVKNLSITDGSVNFEGKNYNGDDSEIYVGSVCGYLYYFNSKISNCSNNSDVNVNLNSTNDLFLYIGGVCGCQEGTSLIENCVNAGNVSCTVNGTSEAEISVGGVIGKNRGEARNCGNTGNVSCVVTDAGAKVNVDVGGVCGGNVNPGVNLQFCFNTGTVTGNGNVGSISGSNTNDAKILYCYWLDGTAEKDVGDTGTGTSTVSCVERKTTEQFVSGEVAWLLNNNGQTNGPWRQNVGTGSTPVLDDTQQSVVRVAVQAEGGEVYYYGNTVTLPDPGAGKAYFNEDDVYIDPAIGYSTDETVYLKDAVRVTVVYGNGAADVQSVLLKGSPYTLPSAPSKSGYAFLGWSDGSATYAAGEELVPLADTVYTAVWVRHPDTEYEPEPEPDPEPELPFYDVSRGDWFYDAVCGVYYAGLMDGVEEHIFAPDGTLTRAMFWTILARADGVDTTGGATWYAKAQEWAVAKGVSDGEDPEGALTREQLVTMLWRLNGEPVVNYLITTPDASQISSWALEAMRWAASTGLIEGDENGLLSPGATTTRAQAATFIWRYLSLS